MFGPARALLDLDRGWYPLLVLRHPAVHRASRAGLAAWLDPGLLVAAEILWHDHA